MDSTVIIVIIAIAIGAALIFFVTRKKSVSGGTTTPTVPSGTWSRLPVPVPVMNEWKHFYTTPKGVSVVSVTNAIPDDKEALVLAAVDAGIDALLLTSAHMNWTNKRKHSDYQVVFVPKAATNMDGTPALMTRNGIQTAGTVVGVGGLDISPSFIVMPESWEFLTYITNVVRYEGEHDLGWANDRNFFYQYTGGNDVHPQFPDLQRGFAAMADREPIRHNCSVVH